MRHIRPLFVLGLLALLALSCATSTSLTRRSEKLLVQGDVDRAFDAAREALEKDPRNEQARAALGAAGTALLTDQKKRFYDLRQVDAVGAARIALDVESIHGTLQRGRVTLPPDTLWSRDLSGAREAASDALIAAADDSLKARQARPAYLLLQQASEFTPQRRGLDARLRRAFDLAVDRVAVLPFDDGIGQPSLPRVLADRLAAALRKRVTDGKLEFTRLVEPSKVFARMTVDQLGDLSRDDAVRLGRDVGANVVLWGRLRDAGTDNNTTYFREPIWHRVTERAADGSTSERWVSVPFEAVVRERVFHLRWDMRLLETDEGNTLDQRSEPRELRVRAVWTNFRPQDDPRDYALVEPAPRDGDSDHAQRAERVRQEWSQSLGRWTLPSLLERSRATNVAQRSTYRHEYRGEFERYDPNLPVFMGDLPGPDDLAYLALRDLDSAFLSMIEDLDRR
jgi:hypothetical protein